MPLSAGSTEEDLQDFRDAVGILVDIEDDYEGCLCVTDDWCIAVLTMCPECGGEAKVCTGVQVPFSDYHDADIDPILDEAGYAYDDIVNDHFHEMCGCGEGDRIARELEVRFEERLAELLAAR